MNTNYIKSLSLFNYLTKQGNSNYLIMKILKTNFTDILNTGTNRLFKLKEGQTQKNIMRNMQGVHYTQNIKQHQLFSDIKRRWKIEEYSSQQSKLIILKNSN
ncbi:hypothetical protein ABPG74_006822 [Tetrahymena malaccensis]